MNVDSILISDYATVTANGKLTVVGVFNRIGPVNLPVRIPLMCISLVIHGHHGEAGAIYQGEIRLINQRREVLTTQPIEVNFNQEPIVGVPLRHLLVHMVLAPVFEEAGAYAIECYIDDTYMAAASFVVVGQ